MGDARLDYNEIVYGFFDAFLKGESDAVLDTHAEGDLLHDGDEQVADAPTRGRRAGAQPMTFYLASGGKANTLNGDGALSRRGARRRQAGRVHLRSDEPGAVVRRQRLLHRQRGRRRRVRSARMEARADILVYTSEPFKEGTEVSGPITPTLYVSSDAKDTDFTVKMLDVYPDGRAFNLDESIQRMRYRDGYDKPLAWMENGKGLQGDAAAADHEQLLRRRATSCASKCRAATSRASIAT